MSPKVQDPTGVFQCSRCGKSYTRVDHLARHVRSHTQDRPYECHICSKRFTRIDLRKRHVVGHETSRKHGVRVRRFNQDHQPGSGTNRVSQACETCAGMHLKCDETKPCKRCLKKDIPCLFEGTTLDEHDFTSQPEESLLLSSEVEQDQEQLPPESTANTKDDRTMHIRNELDVRSEIHSPQAELSLENMMHQDQDAISPPPLSPEATTGLSDPLAYLSTNMFQKLSTPSRGFPNPGLESDTTLNNIDLSFLDFYNINVPFYDDDSPGNVLAGLNSHSPVSSSDSCQSAALGVEAYEKSYWKFRPKRHQSGFAEERNLSLPLESGTQAHPESRVPPIRRMTTEKLTPRTRDRILTVIARSCKRENLPLALASFPSLELLDLLLHFYLSSPLSRASAFIHIATMDIEKARPELLIAMISCGAVMTSDPGLTRLGLALQESIYNSVADLWTNDNSLTRDLELAQAFLIQLEVGFWSGNSRKMEIAESFLQPILTIMRRDNRFRRSSYDMYVRGIETEEGESLAKSWNAWVRQESFKRLMFRILHHDRVVSMSLLNSPLVSYAEVLLPLPESREVWMAPTAKKWKEAALSRLKRFEDCTPGNLVDCLSDVSQLHASHRVFDEHEANLAFIAGAWGLVWEFNQFSSLHKLEPASHPAALVMKLRYDHLIKLLDHFRIGLDAKSPHANEMLMRLEILMMYLHLSLEDVQLFAGVEGFEEARRVQAPLLDWVRSEGARRAIWHAGQVLRMAKSMPKGYLRDFAAIAVYHASLAFWAYGLLSADGPARGTADNLSESAHARWPQVSLDEAETSDLQKFILFGRGLPGISYGASHALLECPAQVLGVVLELIQSNFHKASKPPLVENVTQLMSGLQSAVAGRVEK